MDYRGKKIKAIEIVNESNNNEIVAHICDNKVETTNGYKVKIIPFVMEHCEPK